MSSSPPSAETTDTDDTDESNTEGVSSPKLHEAAFVATSHDILGMLDSLGVDDPCGVLADTIDEGNIQNYYATETTDGHRQVTDQELIHTVKLLNQGSSTVATAPLIAETIGYEPSAVRRRLNDLHDEGELTVRDLGRMKHWRFRESSTSSVWGDS